MQHPRHLRPPMNYTTRPHRDRPIYRQPRPFALASAFGFATAPVFHAAAAAPSTTSLSLSRTIDRSFASISDPQESAVFV
jgi:hypothetical protein